MGEDFISKRECEIMHENLDKRLDSFNESFDKIFAKLDDIANIKGDLKTQTQRVDAIGKKYDFHIDNHGKFITIALSIITLASVVILALEKLVK